MAQKQFGRFEMKSLLGKGAMGAVYLAHDPTLNRDVAIKIVRFPKELDEERLQELKVGLMKEARLAAGLTHPGIVQIYDVGEERGMPFVVMELIKGNLFSSLLQEKGALEPQTACLVFKEMLSGMSYAHEQGVVHLDLKPANIMIGNNWQPRIMDFGIARSVADLRVQEMEVTGTPRYMAPEQITGGKLDTRVDVFSLGVIFYLMLSGNLPFPNKDFDKLKNDITKKPHPPLQNYQGDLPKSYYEFIDRALSKSPADRFESATSMLESFLPIIEKDNKAGKTPDDDEKMNENSRKEILRFILQRMERKGDFPSVSQYVSEVISAARSPNSSAGKIAQTILKDMSLTNRVLRIANSAYYKGLGSAITTISRAVVVLGMDSILNMTSALGIFEHFLKKESGKDVKELKKKVMEALFTALNAREIANQMEMENAEEPFICGMLHHLGRLIVCFYFSEEQEAIDKLIRQENMDEEKASRKIMRLSYIELGQAIAESWNLPKLLQSGLKTLDLDKKGPLKKKEEMLQCVTSYAYELSKATMITDKAKRKVALANLARKFEGKIEIKPKVLNKIIENSIEDAGNFSQTLKLSLKELGLTPEEEKDVKPGKKSAAGPDVDATTLSPDDAMVLSAIEGEDDGMSGDVDDSTAARKVKEEENFMAERQVFLTQTITDISMSLTGEFSISDVIMMVLEGMYRGLGMRNVLLAMVTPKRDQIVFRFGLGPEVEKLRTDFVFPLKNPTDAPVACLLKKEEIVFYDLEKENKEESIPENLLLLLDPKSVLFLPVVVHNKPIGLFFADRSKDQPPITDVELQSIRMLANQLVLALHQSSGGR